MKKNNSYEYQRIRGIKRKVELIKQKGGCCEKCGYNKNIAAFDFHHKNPEEKEYQLDVRKLANTSMIKLIEELKKCTLLCANCHREEHSPDLDFNKVNEFLKNIDNSIIDIKKIGKPKCLDCEIEINYTYKRCVSCNNKYKRKVERPELEMLLNEIKINSQEWCAKKYNVSRTTIKRWIKNKKN
jgi:predicted DNA-binding protein (UPF0251 family)